MKDIVERMRQWREVPGLRDSCPPFLGEGADEIERLRREIESLKRALDFSLQKSAQMAIDAFKLEDKR